MIESVGFQQPSKPRGIRDVALLELRSPACFAHFTSDHHILGLPTGAIVSGSNYGAPSMLEPRLRHQYGGMLDPGHMRVPGRQLNEPQQRHPGAWGSMLTWQRGASNIFFKHHLHTKLARPSCLFHGMHSCVAVSRHDHPSSPRGRCRRQRMGACGAAGRA